MDHPNDELGRLSATLNAMLDRLDQTFAAMRRFTADASHELKTPLATIRTEAEVALQTARSFRDLAEVMESIVEESGRLGRLADRLLDLSREDSREPTEHVPASRLDLAVREAVSRAEVSALRAGVALRLTDFSRAIVAADPDRLAQVFDNLLDNAVKYNRSGGSVLVRGWFEDGESVVEIADTGLGIPTEALDRVFDRFYRVDPSRSRRTGGIGLGLSIVRVLVESLGGRIEVESNLGVGSTFRIRLPLLRKN